MNKTREEVALFISKQMSPSAPPTNYCPDKWPHHYGWCELKDLMDFLYDGPPKNKEKELNERRDFCT